MKIIKKKVIVAASKAGDLIKNERGSLSELTWVVGSAVVVVLIIVVFMALAPNTARDIWDSFTTFATNRFGI